MTLQKYLFRVFYQGNSFNGFQRQLNGNAIENYLELAFIRSNLITSFAENSYQSVSRTDTGVSAIANNFALLCKMTPNLARINANLPNDKSIQVWGFVQISKQMNLRQPNFKIYSYHLSEKDFDTIFDIDRIHQFEGEHNFSSFIKKDGAGKENAISIIQEISIVKTDNGYNIIIQGNKFGREQIRRMIGYIMDSDFVKYNLNEVLDTKQKITIRPASPDSLLLIKIYYEANLNWTGTFDISYLKDGRYHFKPEYDLFSGFENEFV